MAGSVSGIPTQLEVRSQGRPAPVSFGGYGGYFRQSNAFRRFDVPLLRDVPAGAVARQQSPPVSGSAVPLQAIGHGQIRETQDLPFPTRRSFPDPVRSDPEAV
jgi:hypothetical protein